MFLSRWIGRQNGDGGFHRFLAAATDGGARPYGGAEFRDLVLVRYASVHLSLIGRIDRAARAVRGPSGRRVGHRGRRLRRDLDSGRLALALVTPINVRLVLQDQRSL